MLSKHVFVGCGQYYGAKNVTRLVACVLGESMRDQYEPTVIFDGGVMLDTLNMV